MMSYVTKKQLNILNKMKEKEKVLVNIKDIQHIWI